MVTAGLGTIATGSVTTDMAGAMTVTAVATTDTMPAGIGEEIVTTTTTDATGVSGMSPEDGQHRPDARGVATRTRGRIGIGLETLRLSLTVKRNGGGLSEAWIIAKHRVLAIAR